MHIGDSPRVAVLLATYNGCRFVEAQIMSLQQNVTPFTLHWLDDQSTDDTRNRVRSTALSAGLKLKEWHAPVHLGVPKAFFQLVDCVDADVYLFCDQDDIWQPGKIDATVGNLLPDLTIPALCFLDVLVFKDDAPEEFRCLSDIITARTEVTLRESKLFLFNRVMGNTAGFTRPLRDIFLRHKEIADTHAVMHDWWLHIIATASGTSRMIANVPTTLYRLHGNNTAGLYFDLFCWHLALFPDRRLWRLLQATRCWASQQARAFCLISGTLPPGPKVDRLLALAHLLTSLDRRQSPIALLRLIRLGITPPVRSWIPLFIGACLCSNAKDRRVVL